MPTSLVTDDNMGMPMFHEAVLRERLTALHVELNRQLDDLIQDSTNALRFRTRDMLIDATRRAYAAGVRDGFAQGVAAEAALRGERPPC